MIPKYSDARSEAGWCEHVMHDCQWANEGNGYGKECASQYTSECDFIVDINKLNPNRKDKEAQ